MACIVSIIVLVAALLSAVPLSVALPQCSVEEIKLRNCSCFQLPSSNALNIACSAARLAADFNTGQQKAPTSVIGGLAPQAGGNVPILPDAVFSNVNISRLKITDSGLYYIRSHAFNLEQLQSILELDLSSNAFRDLPIAAISKMHQLENLNMANNQIIYVPKGPLLPLRKLKWLDLRNNRIMFIDDEALSGMQSLSALTLSNNFLEKLTPNTFRGLKSLRTLVLKNNPLKLPHLHQNLFPRDLSHLKYLDLSNCNVQRINANTFANLHSLEELDLSKNKIVDFHPNSFMGLPEIKILHIAHNRALRGLASNLLKPMPSLQEFDATGCAIRTVPAAFFDNSRMLKRLKLNDNNIDTLPHELFRSLLLLEEVFLAGNEFTCDFRLAWLRSWLTAKNEIVMDGEKIKCWEPLRLRGIKVTA